MNEKSKPLIKILLLNNNILMNLSRKSLIVKIYLINDRLGLNLMKTISVKSEEYIARIKDRVNKPEYLGVESPLRMSDEIFSFEDQTLRESFNRQADKLTVIELEKEIMHTRTVLSVVFLPKLALIEELEVLKKFYYFS